MNTLDACKLLGIQPGASKEDVKKAFKKKAAELHPDRNKEPDAEQKFKEVNEAYQLLDKYGTDYSPGNVNSLHYNMSDDLAEEIRRQMDEVFGRGVRVGGGINFQYERAQPSTPIFVPLEIPFEMAVLGGKKDITYERTLKCERSGCKCGDLEGANKKICHKCGGHGYRKYGNDDKQLPCNICKATGYVSDKTKCPDCIGGAVNKVETLKVIIPPGAQTGLRLFLRGKGHYNPGGFFDHVVVVINVLPDHDMQLNGNDVIGVVELTLLEALKGTRKKLRTVKGEKLLAFKPKTRHRDTVRVTGFGVPPDGSHIVIVNVNYPDNVSKLIETLENTDEPEPEEISGVQS